MEEVVCVCFAMLGVPLGFASLTGVCVCVCVCGADLEVSKPS